MVAYTFYELDNRVMRYADTLVKQGHEVDVVALRREAQPSVEVLNGITIYRIQKRVINEGASITYLYKLLLFLFRSGLFLARRQVYHPYDLIHVHSVPDFEVFAALFPKLMGAKVILDIHDIVPELYATKFRVGYDTLVFKALVWMEKISGAFSDHVIVANHIWYATLLSRSIPASKCSVIMNYPSSHWFQVQRQPREKGKLTLLYPGTLSWHQGIDVAIRAMDKVVKRLPHAELHIYGDGNERKKLTDLIAKMSLQNHVFIHGLVSSEEMSSIMAAADLGIEPKRNDGFSGDAFSTKILEFMAAGVPVIASTTRVHRHYFNDSVLKFFDCDDAESLADAIFEVATELVVRDGYVARARSFVQDFDWTRKERLYLDLVQSLMESRP